MTKRNIPSEEDFRRAQAAVQERQRGLSEVCDRIIDLFGIDDVHEAFMFYSPREEAFGAFIFFRLDRQIDEADKSGLSIKIKDAVYEELEKVGRGSRTEIKVDLEFDSHENVEANFEGDYFLRLR